MAYQVIFAPGIGQFREFEPRRVHTRTNSFIRTFLVHYLTCGKRESVGQLHLKKNTSSGNAETYMRDKNRSQESGGRGDDTCGHGLSRSWKVKVSGMKKV